MTFLHEGAGPEVNQLQLPGLQVHQDVLILDIAVEDSGSVAGKHRLRNLLEEVPRYFLLYDSFLRNVVEHILGVGRMLQDEDEGVLPLEVLDEPDYSLYSLYCVQQAEFHGNTATVKSVPVDDLAPCHMFDGHCPVITPH